MNGKGSREQVLGKWHLADLAILAFLLALVPLIHYGVRASHRSLKLEFLGVEPQQLEAGPGAKVILTGNGFDQKTSVLVSNLKVASILVNAARLDAYLPNELGFGHQSVTIRNGLGRMVHATAPFKLLWRPRIDHLSLAATPQGDAVLELRGDYFESGCRVRLNEMTATGKEYHSRNRVTAHFSIRNFKKGSYALGITNAYSGVSVVMPDALQIEEPLTGAVAFSAYCALRVVPPHTPEMFPVGWTYQDSFGQPAAEVLEVLGTFPVHAVPKPAASKTASHLIFARMLLFGREELVPNQAPYFNLEGEHILLGKRIVLKQLDPMVDLLVLSAPLRFQKNFPAEGS